MNTIPVEQITEDWIKIYAQPEPKVIDQINVRDKGVIKSLFGDQNEIWLGRPQAYYLKDLLPVDEDQNQVLKHLSLMYDMILMQFACSFRAASGCEFVRATVQVHMGNVEQGIESPIAYDIFPIEVMMPVTYKRTLSLNPSLALGFEKVAQIEISAFQQENSEEYILYQPEIVGFAKGESEPGWDFNKSSSRKCQIKDLFVLIKPKLSQTRLCLSVSNCQVQTNIGRIPLSTLFLSGTEGVLFTEEYIIV